MTPDQRDTLTAAVWQALDDRNDYDMTMDKAAEAVVRMLERADSDVRAALWSLLTEGGT